MSKNMRKKDIRAVELCEELEQADPGEIVRAAIAEFNPVKIYVGFSGGFDSLVATHWSMRNIPGCEVFHVNTGIGIPATTDYVKEMCVSHNWPLRIIKAKEDCGKDYDELVKRFGFPGPAMHSLMFRNLKERAVEKLLRDSKTHRADNAMLITGIRQDESQRRSGYQRRIISFKGNLLWVSAFYYKPRCWFSRYVEQHHLKRNPVSEVLGMSGECLCGAFAHPGEKELIKIVCPATHARIEALEREVRASGHDWGWEDTPPRKRAPNRTEELFPMCIGCGK